jgi:hypothetical protein
MGLFAPPRNGKQRFRLLVYIRRMQIELYTMMTLKNTLKLLEVVVEDVMPLAASHSKQKDGTRS